MQAQSSSDPWHDNPSLSERMLPLVQHAKYSTEQVLKALCIPLDAPFPASYIEFQMPEPQGYRALALVESRRFLTIEDFEYAKRLHAAWLILDSLVPQ